MATTNTSTTCKHGFEKLNRSNWSSWSVKFRGVCRRKGIDEALIDAASQHSSKVLGEMTGCVGDEFLHTVDDAESAAAAWNQLRQLFRQTSESNYHNIRQQFNSLALKPGETILEYVSRGKDLVEQLAEAQDLVDDRGLTTQLLAGLPTDYLLISKMLRRQQPFPNLTEVQGTLLNEEQEIKQRSASSNSAQPPATDRAPAFFSNSNGGNGNQRWRQDRNAGEHNDRRNDRDHNMRCYYCGKKGHTKAECRKRLRDEERRARMRDSPNSRQDGNNGMCDYCGKPNHTAAECRHKLRAEQARGNNRTNHNNVAFTASASSNCGRLSSTSGNLAYASAATTYCAGLTSMANDLTPATLYPADTWVIDSGASRHMSGHSSIFSELRALDKPAVIDYGDGSQLEAVAEGTVVLLPSLDQSPFSRIEERVTLRNVFYIPGHKANLLATRLITRAGGKVTQSQNSCVISYNGAPIMSSTPRSAESLLTLEHVRYDINSTSAQSCHPTTDNTASDLAPPAVATAPPPTDGDDEDIPDLQSDSESIDSDDSNSISDGSQSSDPDSDPQSSEADPGLGLPVPAATEGQAPAGAGGNAATGTSATRRSARATAGVPSSRYHDFALTASSNSFGFGDIPEPKTYAEAMASEHAAEWQHAMNEEIGSLLEQGTWDYVPTPPGIKPIPVKWVFKVKRDGQGRVERFKARVVAKGFKQQEGIDYDEVFAPVSKYTTFRTLMAIAAAYDLEIQQLDIKTAFLQGELAERIYIQQPEGFQEGSTGTCCLLNKAIYGLKQAPRVWHNRLHEELGLIGFKVSEADPGMYVYDDKSGPTYLLVYVDDILLVSSSMAMINSIRDRLLSTFDARDLGTAVTYLGINILRDRGSRSITLIQQRMTADIISKFGLSEATAVSVPLSPSIKLSKEEGLPMDTSHFPYSQMVGSLMYLSVCTRPDISFAVGALARYMSCPTTTHSQAAKSVGRYLKGTANLGITYSGTGSLSFRGSSNASALAKGGNTLDLLGFCDADYAADCDTRRSTTGYVFTLNGGAISWQSKRQPTVAASTAEAEYMAAAAAVKEGLWLRKLLTDLGQPTSALKIFADNQSAIKLLRNPISSMRSKHIDIAHHFARERVMRGEIAFSYISTTDQVADIFTKALPAAKLRECRADMGLKAASPEVEED